MTTIDTASRVDAFLRDRLGETTLPPHDTGLFRDFLKTVSLMDIVGAVEHADRPPGAAATIELYQLWIAAQPPGSAYLHMAWFNLAVALSSASDQPGAILAYQSALALRPDFHSAAVNLGIVLESLGQTEAALRTWERSLQPDDARLLLINNRARLLEQMGRLAESEQELRRSLLTDPRQPDVIQHWVHVRQKMCAWPVLCNDIPGLPIEDLIRHAGPMATLALTDDVARQCKAGADWIARKTAPVPTALCPPDGYRHDRIRLGYLSSDFCSHAMSYLIAELFERHDRNRFEVFGYCSSPEDGSPIRDRVVASFDRFRRIKDLSDKQAARLIRDDEIDILIDLNGLTSGVRLPILRCKPAPVQATYLGFVGPVPLPELDYMFCDHLVVPADAASAYAPPPLHIAPNYQANDSKRAIGSATTRADAGLPDDRFIYCCFSNHYKITETIFSAWMEILHRAGNAILWLIGDNEWARRNMLDRAARHGIDPNRIVFAARVAPDAYMARLRLADVFLDTFPYNAGTIASDAIRMGLPLVTLQGRSFASRMAASLLTAAGSKQGIATTLPEYIEFAASLANDPSALSLYKLNFTTDNWQRSIGDIATFTAHYEQSLETIAKRARS